MAQNENGDRLEKCLSYITANIELINKALLIVTSTLVSPYHFTKQLIKKKLAINIYKLKRYQMVKN